MTREQAQEILLLLRPGASVDNDPDMAEALQFAANDPELSAWLSQHNEAIGTISKQLQTIEPPSDLKARILAGAQPKTQQRPSQTYIWAIAAGIVLLIGAANFWLGRIAEDAPTFANFRSRMISFALRTYAMDIVTNNETVVRQYLATQGAPADFPLTSGLQKLPVKGGGRLSWQNQPVAMMCFSLTNNQTAFMFVIDQKSIEKPTPALDVNSTKSFASITWTNAGKIYLLAAAERPEVLQSLAVP